MKRKIGSSVLQQMRKELAEKRRLRNQRVMTKLAAIHMAGILREEWYKDATIINLYDKGEYYRVSIRPKQSWIAFKDGTIRNSKNTLIKAKENLEELGIKVTTRKWEIYDTPIEGASILFNIKKGTAKGILELI